MRGQKGFEICYFGHLMRLYPSGALRTICFLGILELAVHRMNQVTSRLDEKKHDEYTSVERARKAVITLNGVVTSVSSKEAGGRDVHILTYLSRASRRFATRLDDMLSALSQKVREKEGEIIIRVMKIVKEEKKNDRIFKRPAADTAAGGATVAGHKHRGGTRPATGSHNPQAV
ncbi:hypothetical protein ACLOJK_006488 [Asimina triloba]